MPTTQRIPAHKKVERSEPGSLAPSQGLIQADHDGQTWLCEAVIQNQDPGDYYLVRLCRLAGSDPVGEPVVLSPREYREFRRNRRLKTVLL